MMRTIIIGWSLFAFTSLACANVGEWNVTPNVCLAEKPQDLCQMEVDIQVPLLPADRYCLSLEQQVIECWVMRNTRSLAKRVTVRLADSATLHLLNGANEIVLSQLLTQKTRLRAPTRRRVRQPWSLF